MLKESFPYKNLLIEILSWYLLPLAFLTFYVSSYSHSLSSVSAHLYILSLIIFIIITIRVLIFHFFDIKKISIYFVSTLYASAIFSLICYYGLVIIGLKSWGRVISQELITSYTKQAHQLLEVLGLSYSLIIAILSGTFIITLVASYTFIHQLSWKITPQRISSKIYIAMLFTGLVVLSFKLWECIDDREIDSKEPIHLTLWGSKPKTPIHSAVQGASGSKFLNAKERQTITSYRVAPTAERRNLILIVVDALKPANMGVYGYYRETTPYLSQLKSSSQLKLLNNVHSSCSESACGLISLASSRYVHELPEEPFTLQKVLKLHDYAVHMILGGDHTNFYNLKEYYGPVDSYFDGSMAKNFYVNNDNLVIEQTKKLPDWNKKPTMIQYHLMSSHPLGVHKKEDEIYLPAKSYTGLTSGPPEKKYINFYDNGVQKTDATIHKLLDELKAKHYLENALIVITADHGEALGEHAKYSHANSLYEEALNIPFLLISMGKESIIDASRTIVSQVDIAPTILHEFKMAIPANWSGQPIQVDIKPDFTFFQLYPYEGLYDHRDSNNLWKYWFNPHTTEEHVYNLTLDPNEKLNLSDKVQPQLKQAWRNQLSSNKL